MRQNETNNGKRGGLLKGKPHYDKNGKPLGGIKAIVTDINTPVELEGGEVIINKEASKKYWRELSKINQSAGNGVPIKNPNGSFDEDPEEYKDGGNVIQFNANHTPSKIILNYAKKIKSDYPKVWDKGGNIFGNEAFNNLNRVSERGYWLDSEKWMYIKWRSYVARHKQDFRINGVVAMLKWVDKVDKGWSYMKDLIESEIDKKYPTKMAKGGQVVTYKNKFNKKYGFDENESHSLEEISKIAKIKLSSLQDIYDKGIGAYKTNPESVRPNVKSKEQWAMARVYSAIMGGKASKVDANELSEGKMEHGGKVKEPTKRMKQKNVVKPDYSNNDEVSKENIEMVVNQNKQILHHTEELKKALNSGAQVPAWVVAKINRAANDMSDATHYLDGTLRYAFGGNIQSGQMYDWTKYGVENTIYVTEIKDEMVFYKLNGVNKVRGMKEFVKFLEDNNLKAGFEFKDGGEIPKGIKEEAEHKMVLNELYQRKITPEQSLEIIAKDHVAKDPKYYSKLEKYGLQSGGVLVNPKDKIDYDLKSDAFVNTEIFKSEMDYIIGGFMVDELNKIRVVGDSSALNMAKLDAIFTKRLELAIESFKSSIVSLDDNGFIESDDTNEDIVNEINNMFETYLGITFISADTEAIVDIIKRDTSYLTWVGRIESRLNSYKNRLNYNVEDVIMSEANKMSIKEIEYLTLNSTLEDIFEQLYQVNEQNTI
jgi:hypothetical protein